MKVSFFSLVLSASLVCSCDSPDVNNVGSYKFFPGGAGVDTVVYPLSTLLVVEQDAQSERTLFYLFEGDLGRADLGIRDLRSIAFEYGLADLRFDFPLSQYGFRGGEGGQGGQAGASSEASTAPEPVRTLSVDGQSVDLYEVTDLTAFELGVTRFLAAIVSTDYAVRAYWGSLDNADGFARVRWTRGAVSLEHAAEISPVKVFPTRGDEDALIVDHDELSGADYKVVDLYQRIVEREEGTELEALVRTSFATQTEYQATPDLVASVWRSLCWSRDRALFARVEQVARSYHKAQDRGDMAVIHRRRDFARVRTALWEASAPEGEPPSYCEAYE